MTTLYKKFDNELLNEIIKFGGSPISVMNFFDKLLSLKIMIIHNVIVNVHLIKNLSENDKTIIKDMQIFYNRKYI